MTPIAWVVENSLLADERFRNLTVMPKPNSRKTSHEIEWLPNGYWIEEFGNGE